ncbi:MAG: alanine racemase [Synechococcus lacustris]|jgi:alanine racemase
MSYQMHGRAPGEELLVGPQQRAWVEINREAISHNTACLKRSLAPACALMAVVKADGYGHGAVTVAEAALAGGASSFGVATLAEGIELRQAGLTAPILVLGNLQQPEEFRCCLHWRLMPTLSGLGQGLICSQVGAAGGRPLEAHLKLDTGMARLGVAWEQGPQLLEALSALEGLQVQGVYSHLADADQLEGSLTRQQQQRFEGVLQRLQDLDLQPGLRHLANSAGTLSDRSLHYDLVRVGLALYGHAPAPHLAQSLPLRPAMAVRARVTLLRDVPAGVGVSYGHRHVTSRPSRLAVLGIGYADGVSRQLSGRLEVLAQGQRLPQVGSITMDQLVVDATALPELEVGSVVTLLGESEGDQIGPEAWGEICGSIPWEVLCGFKHRLPRLPSRRGH